VHARSGVLTALPATEERATCMEYTDEQATYMACTDEQATCIAPLSICMHSFAAALCMLGHAALLSAV
jgi:hypothetical protein